jgi:exodeoxyribonuclease V gamma subunit
VFNLNQSNDLDVLVQRLAELIAEPCGANAVLAPETIVVQSQGMHHWVSMQIAQRLGVAANIAYPFPDAFARDVFNANMPTRAAERFAPQTMLWSILDLLPSLISDPSFAPVHDYLEDDRTGTKAYQLAERLASLYDAYGVYRPEMLLEWTYGDGGRNGHAVWQAALWSKLTEGAESQQPAARRRHFLKQETKPKGLPKRVFVFGITSLPPFYLQLLEHISTFVDVHVFVQSPCREFWSHARSERAVLKDAIIHGMSAEHFKDRFHHDSGNPLLTSMGRHIQDFSMMLPTGENAPIIEEETYRSQDGQSLLDTLRRDVFDFVDGAEASMDARCIANDDLSLRVHVCHSPMREVQVLHDQLLSILKTNEASPDLAPNDIVVMVPDIEAYAPYIDAVFACAYDDSYYIPFSISDRATTHTNPAASFLLSLFALPSTRFSSRDLMSILEIPMVRQRFGISESEFVTAARLVVQSGIRWGFDPEQREAMSGVPSTETGHTWLFGIERLLLGYALPGDGTTLFEGRLPDRDVEGADAVTAGKLAHFARALNRYLASLNRPRSVAAWSRYTTDALHAFLSTDQETRAWFDQVQLIVTAIGDESRLAGFDEPVAGSVFAAALTQRLEAAAEHGRYMTRGVTFCSLLPFRGIPFKIVCLLGMNDGDFPRGDHPPAFDLMAAYPRLGDRSRRDDDRYMFLEAMLSAGERLLISYTGRDIRDNSIRPPSPVVSELIEYIDRSFVTGSDGAAKQVSDAITVAHPLQPFSASYFDGTNSELFSYSEEYANAMQGNMQNSYRKGTRFDDPISITEDSPLVSLDAFLRFFANPSRFYLSTRMNVFAGNDYVDFDENEPFGVGGLERYMLTRDVLAMRETGQNDEDIFKVARAAGRLPHGVAADAAVANAIARVDTFLEAHREATAGRTPISRDISIHHSEFSVNGVLHDIFEDTFIAARCGRLRDRDLLNAWIRHLIANTGNATATRLVGLDKNDAATSQTFAQLEDRSSASDLLQPFLEAFQTGRAVPLRVFPATSMAFAKTLVSSEDVDKALQKAKTVWYGNDFGGAPAECQDAYHKMIYGETSPLDERFMDLSRNLLLPLAERITTKAKGGRIKPTAS